MIEQGAEMLGWALDDLLTRTIEAMRQSEDWVIEETNRLIGQAE